MFFPTTATGKSILTVRVGPFRKTPAHLSSMTREEFNAQYELLKEVGTPGGSFHALSGSGAVVMVHFLGPRDSAAAQDILDKVGKLEPAEGRRIVESTDVDGTSVVVTKFITDFQSFEAWLEMRVAGTAHPQPPSLSSPPPAPPRPADIDPSEAPTKVLPRGGLGPSVEEPPPDEPTPQRGSGGPGEFTRMFQASGGGEPAPMEPTPPEATPRPDPPSDPPPVAPATPGEFTRMFQAGGAPVTPPPRPESGPEPEAPPPPLPPRPPPKTADPVAPRIPDEFPGSKPAWWGPLDQEAPKQPQEPGAFTRMFRTSGMPGEIAPRPDPTTPLPPGGAPRGEPPPPPPLSLGNEPYLDRLRPEPESALPSSLPPVRSTRPPVPSGPGEFTRVIQGTPGQMSSPAPPVPAPPPPIPPPPTKPPKTGMLILGAVGILTLAVIIVLLFALLGQGGAESGAESPPNQESPEGP